MATFEADETSALRATEVGTRFVFTFHYEPSTQILDLLLDVPGSVWSQSPVPSEYLEERAESVWANQFGTEKGKKTAKGYGKCCPGVLAPKFRFRAAGPRSHPDGIADFHF